jgi:hypothetical protein
LVGEAAMTTATRRRLDARIRGVLAYLDADVTDEMVAEYRQSTLEQHGSLAAALALDERDIQ